MSLSEPTPSKEREVERWSRRANLAAALVRTHLTHMDHPEHIDSLRRLMARRWLVVPILDLENAWIVAEEPSPAGLAEAVAGSIRGESEEFLPPAFQRLQNRGWLEGPGVAPTLSERLFEGTYEERRQLTQVLEQLTQTPFLSPVTRQDFEFAVPAEAEVVSSAELARRATNAQTLLAQPTSLPQSAALCQQARVLCVYIRDRHRILWEELTPTLFKALKLLPAFGCARLWVYAPGGFDIDYERDLSGTREFSEEGAALYDRIAFLSPLDIALLLIPDN